MSARSTLCGRCGRAYSRWRSSSVFRGPLLALVARALPPVAGRVGALSFFGVTSLKSEAESLFCFGTG